jgi:hypothetical protein
MLNTNTAPPGADYGNYLTQVNVLNGSDLRGWGLREQPLYIVLLDGFTLIFDAFTALKVAAALVFSIVTIPFFMLARKLSGNDIAAAISAGLFAFFISYTEMIAWGGNPNFFAFSFMLLALYFVIDMMKKPSKANVVLSGLFISLVIGTHILVGVFTFAALFLFFVLNTVFGERRKEALKRDIKAFLFLILAAAVFSLPYVSYYLEFFKNSSSEMVGFQFINLQFGVVPIGAMWSILTAFFAIGIVGGLGLFALAKYFKEEKVTALLLSSLFITTFVLFMITAQPIRWIYFLPIPFLLCFSIFLKRLFCDIKQAKKTTIMVCTVLFIALIAVNSSGIAAFHYLGTAQPFYQFIGHDEIEALKWIKTTPEEAIFATSGSAKNVGGGGNSYAWWVEGYDNRVCMFTGDLEYFSYQQERDEVRLTNRVFAGTYGIEYGNLKVIEGYPAGSTNPQIDTFVNDDYVHLFVLNDAQNQLYYIPDGSSQAMSVGSFYSGSNQTATVTYDGQSANITVTYGQPNFELVRSVVVDGDQSSVDLYFTVTPINAALQMFKINLWSMFSTTPDNCIINADKSMSLTQSIAGKNLTATISVVDTNGEVSDARLIFDNIQKASPVASYSFNSTQDNLYVHLKVSIDSPTPPKSNPTIYCYNSYDLLKELNVSYVMLSKYKSDELYRFSHDPHFTVAFEDDTVIIFEVN